MGSLSINLSSSSSTLQFVIPNPMEKTVYAERCLSCNLYFAICNYPCVRNNFKKGLLDNLLIFILILGGGGKSLGCEP